MLQQLKQRLRRVDWSLVRTDIAIIFLWFVIGICIYIITH